MKIIERNLQEIGKSLFVSLPKEWTRVLNLKKGSKIKMIITEQGNISIAPEFAKEKKRNESKIYFDNHFERRFFRDYFNGIENITIFLKGELREKERKELYSFLKMFMNVQIVEESPAQITVKSFKIEELSIEECLRRMYFLSMGMIEELVSQNDKTKINEMRDTMTRFYYMAVMQIRIFLSEGKFAKENQIPLIRSLDFRMTAEKIQRIGSVIASIESVNDEQSAELAVIIKEYYSKVFNSFVSEDYDKALSLWSEGKYGLKKYEKIKVEMMRTKNIGLYQRINSLLQILNYCKEISMLVR